jgi:hypothetical protein
MSLLPPAARRFAVLALIGTVPLAGAGCADGEAGTPRTGIASASASAPGAASYASAPLESVPARSLGTIEAVLDGEPRVWHVVRGEASDGPYASGVWFQLPDGPVAVVLGGFDSPDPPIETFSRGGGGAQASVGDYRGSSLSLQVQLSAEAGPAGFALPADEGRAMVVFTPVFDAEDMSGLRAMASGEVEVLEASRTGEEMSLRGTFSGRLEPMGAGEPVTVTEGRFEVRGIPSAESIQPGG